MDPAPTHGAAGAFFLTWTAVLCFLVGAIVLCEVIPLMPGPPAEGLVMLLWLVMLPILAMVGFAAAGLIAVPSALLWARGAVGLRRRYLLSTAAVAGLTIGMVVTRAPLRVTDAIRTTMFARLADRSQPLIAGITRFSEENGKPPASLDDLVPQYIDQVPYTGMMGYPEYEYEAFGDSASESKFVWYDLGSRRGRDYPGMWVYTEGDPEHAILVLGLEKGDIVSWLETDRLPAGVGGDRFSRDRWRQVSARFGMVDDLLRSVPLRGGQLAEAVKILGQPDGERVLVASPWELRVPCPTGGLNWDVFFYWPTGKYPASAYGGTIEPIRDWAYVYE